VARVAVDSGLAHLDRPFDYAVPAEVSDKAVAGCRVRVRFAGRLVDGVLLERATETTHAGALTPLTLVSPEPVLSPEVACLARAVADRYAGSLYDVLRLALPPRHARVEAEPPGEPAAVPEPPAPGSWSRYRAGEAFLTALAEGRSPRAVWTALPGPTWPAELAAAVQACVSGGRGALVVVPDARDLARVAGALAEAGVDHVALSADLGPTERYRRWLRVRRGLVRAVVGTRAAAFAPVADLGLVAVWDDGDDLHAEPRAPYPDVRDVLVQRAHLTGAAALVGGLVRTAEGQLLCESRWARPLEAPREQVRAAAPRVDGISDDDLARDPLARAARLPATAFAAARAALAAGAPVLVQVPRRGYVPQLACARDGTPARCPVCAGPLAAASGTAVAACRWCGHLAADWRCPVCEGRALRALVVGSRRTAEELGKAFPGVPVRTSGRDEVLARVPAEPALVVATPGAEPVAEGGYGAVLLLDAWAALGRADLRAGEEALRRWAAAAALARPAGEGGHVLAVADRGLAPLQALTRWDPAGAAGRELAERTALSFPPATRMAAVDGAPAALADLLAVLELPAGAEVLGPVAAGDGERLLLRVARRDGGALAVALKAAVAVRSARKAEAVRVELDPRSLT
jgi:primosomal protein N' (replication factor Y) (superfamily II helicase)